MLAEGGEEEDRASMQHTATLRAPPPRPELKQHKELLGEGGGTVEVRKGGGQREEQTPETRQEVMGQAMKGGASSIFFPLGWFRICERGCGVLKLNKQAFRQETHNMKQKHVAFKQMISTSLLHYPVG